MIMTGESQSVSSVTFSKTNPT